MKTEILIFAWGAFYGTALWSGFRAGMCIRAGAGAAAYNWTLLGMVALSASTAVGGVAVVTS